MIGYLSAADGKRILCDAADAKHFRSQRLVKINQHQYGNYRIGCLARAIVRRYQRLKPTDIVVAVRGNRDLRRRSLIVMPANSGVVRQGAGVVKTRHGTYEATIYSRGVLWRGRYATYAGAQRERTKALKKLGFL